MKTMNYTEREDWVLNDIYLYSWHQSSGQGMRSFILENQTAIDKHIKEKLA